MDHEMLLRMYIRHVIECAGTDFLSHKHEVPGLTKEENAALHLIGDQVLEEHLLQ